jgi:lipopolysaccharide/colanic/teichoic acid biosynthesis glycosyltransferase
MWPKRLLDVVVSLTALVVLSPVMAAIALLIVVRDGRPILFSQRRSGLHGRPFMLRKYRTMSTESEDPTTDGQRITALGAKLRATSLDELPTLLNVLRGDMSLVGPRPLPERYYERYTFEQQRRLEVRPGVTGLAQVRGRNLLSWEERFELDVDYVDTRSLVGDVRLLVDTVRAVARREGIEAEGAVTMPEFFGSETESLPPAPEPDLS